MRPALCLLLWSLLLTWQGVLQAADVRCFTRVHCEGNLLSTVSTPRECCIERPSGVSYDYSGQIEKCHACEVLGWRKSHVYAVENTDVSLIFGNVRGAAEGQSIWNVEYVSDEANANVLQENYLNSVTYRGNDLNVKVRLPKYSTGDRYITKNTTLRMVRQLPIHLEEAQFIHPQEVTIHIIVPEVGFESRIFRTDISEEMGVPVCLSYSNTGGGYAQFTVNISITSQDGGFSKRHMFPFTPRSGRSCDSVSLSLSSIRDPFTDTVFSAAIAPLNQLPFDLGTLSTASLIVRALKVAEVEFEESLTTYTLPVTSVETCLTRTPPDGDNTILLPPLTVNVTLVTGITGVSQVNLSVDFSENSTRTCMSIELTSAETDKEEQNFKLFIINSRLGLPTFEVGSRSSTVVVVKEGEKEGGGGGGGEDVVPDVGNAALKDSSGSSGPDSWVIGVTVAVPVFLLLVVAIITGIIVVVVYRFKYYHSKDPVSQDTHIPHEKA